MTESLVTRSQQLLELCTKNSNSTSNIPLGGRLDGLARGASSLYLLTEIRNSFIEDTSDMLYVGEFLDKRALICSKSCGVSSIITDVFLQRLSLALQILRRGRYV